MWNKDDERNEPGGGAPSPRPQSSGGGEGTAYIGPNISIEGTITGAGDLTVDGQVKGKVTLKGNALTIGSKGVVDADVEAREVRVHGKLKGATSAKDRMEIAKSGSVEGNVTTSRIAVEDGALFRGSVDIATSEDGAPKKV